MIARIFTICIASATLAACGSPNSPVDAGRRDGGDPPVVARKLSLGGQASATAAGPYEGAVNCVVALRITAQQLQAMRTDKDSPEMLQVAKAEEGFRRRALAAEGGTEARVTADVRRGLRAKANDQLGQAQLALACLQSLQPAVG